MRKDVHRMVLAQREQDLELVKSWGAIALVITVMDYTQNHSGAKVDLTFHPLK